MNTDVTVDLTGDQNFSQIAKLVEKEGYVVVYNNNKKFLVIDLDLEPPIKMREEEEFEFMNPGSIFERI